MVPYKNAAGNSGVIAYEIGTDRIIVQFVGGDSYVYTNASAGVANIKRMKELAKNGRGLSTFISQQVSDIYAQKYSRK